MPASSHTASMAMLSTPSAEVSNRFLAANYFPGSADFLTGGDAPGPAEADFVEIEFGMLGADVMEDAGDGLANSVIKAFGGIVMDDTTSIFLASVAHGFVIGEVGAGPHDGLPFITHQMGVRGHGRSSNRSVSFNDRSATTEVSISIEVWL